MKENKSGVYAVEEEWLFEHIVRGAARACVCVRGARRYDGVRNDCATLPARACLALLPASLLYWLPLAKTAWLDSRDYAGYSWSVFIIMLIIYLNNDNSCCLRYQKKVNVLS